MTQVLQLAHRMVQLSHILPKTLNVTLTSSFRNLGISAIHRCEAKVADENPPETFIDPKIDRTKIVPVSVSVKYLASAAYNQTYGDQPVWVQYRRNFKGLYPPSKTRKTCVRKGVISTGSPCPICRDEFLVLDHNNIDLLKQFVSPQTGKVLSYSKTGLCQKKHLELLIAIDRAKDQGLITFDVPFREFDYSEYYKQPKA